MPDDLAPLEMSAPPWWNAWQRYAARTSIAPSIVDPQTYETAQAAYEAAYVTLYGELERLDRDALFRRVTMIGADLVRHNARTRGGRRAK